MLKRNMTAATLAGAGMLVLILDSGTALSGAAAGVELCLKTVIPSLFPFLFLCALLTNALWGQPFPRLRPLGRLLGIPRGAESLLVCALLGGYPAGAQAVGDAFRADRLTEEDARHLLRFCSNAGPAFLFGMTALQFPQTELVWALWGIHILAALLTGLSHSQQPSCDAQLPGYQRSPSRILTDTVRTMGSICGWILLLRILSAFLERWFLWRCAPALRVALTGLLELSNGCLCLGTVDDLYIRFLICTGLLSFGGLCVAMQTASVIAPLSLKPYLAGKTGQTLYALILAAFYWRLKWPGLLCGGTLMTIVLIFRKKAVDFRKEPVYNGGITTGRNQSHAVS